jgi:hypothetical protein
LNSRIEYPTHPTSTSTPRSGGGRYGGFVSAMEVVSGVGPFVGEVREFLDWVVGGFDGRHGGGHHPRGEARESWEGDTTRTGD